MPSQEKLEWMEMEYNGRMIAAIVGIPLVVIVLICQHAGCQWAQQFKKQSQVQTQVKPSAGEGR